MSFELRLAQGRIGLRSTSYYIRVCSAIRYYWPLFRLAHQAGEPPSPEGSFRECMVGPFCNLNPKTMCAVFVAKVESI